MANARKRQTAALKVKAPGAKQSIDRMKYEIANEFGVNLGPNASSRDNGIVGGEITKRINKSIYLLLLYPYFFLLNTYS